MIRHWKYLLLFFFVKVTLFSQHIGLYVDGRLGFLIKHTDKFAYSPKGVASFIELGLFDHTYNKYEWHEYYNHPRIGVALRYMDLGEPQEILGNAIGIYPFFDFTVKEKQDYNLHFKVGMGLAYLQKKYDALVNPYQNTIGSHFNNLTNLQLLWEFKLKKNIYWQTGISINHMSNGAYQVPNLGLNYVQANLSYVYLKKQNSSLQNKIRSDSVHHRWNYQIEYGLGYKEVRVIGGPKFPIHAIGINALYRYKKFKSWAGGIEIEYYASIPYFAELTDNYTTAREAWKTGLKYNLFMDHEWRFGQSCFRIRTGYQIIRGRFDTGYRFYNKYMYQYYLPKVFQRIQFCLGAYLKSNYVNADYFGLHAGIRFCKK